MANFRGKIRGEFEMTQDVTAETEEEARQMLKQNRGAMIEETATGDLEILEIIEID